MNCLFRISALIPYDSVEGFRNITTGGDFVGRWGMGAQLTVLIPPQFLAGEPACTLDKTTLNLAFVNGRVKRFTDIVEGYRLLTCGTRPSGYQVQLRRPQHHMRSTEKGAHALFPRS